MLRAIEDLEADIIKSTQEYEAAFKELEQLTEDVSL